MKLYYEEELGEFYTIKETPKSVVVELVEHLACDGESLPRRTFFDKKLNFKKDNRCKHTLKFFENNQLLAYPYKAGQPFYLKEATHENILSEIKDCDSWGISSKFYKDLMENYEIESTHK